MGFDAVHRWTLPHQNTTIAYRQNIPKPAGTLLLLLHGFCDSSAVFSRLLPLLPADCGYVAMDWRGQGQSDWAPAGVCYCYADFVADLVAFVAHLRLMHSPARLICVGHSFGGLIAQARCAVL